MLPVTGDPMNLPLIMSALAALVVGIALVATSVRRGRRDEA
ncbi:hypothetical protein AB0I28_01550 [Phytomonospora sp. NPDC050363]